MSTKQNNDKLASFLGRNFELHEARRFGYSEEQIAVAFDVLQTEGYEKFLQSVGIPVDVARFPMYFVTFAGQRFEMGQVESLNAALTLVKHIDKQFTIAAEDWDAVNELGLWPNEHRHLDMTDDEMFQEWEACNTFVDIGAQTYHIDITATRCVARPVPKDRVRGPS